MYYAYIYVIYVVSIMIVMHIEKPFKFEGLIRINFVMNNIQHWLYLFTFIHIECSIVKITIVLWTNYIAWSLKDYSFSESFCLLYQHNLINTIYLKHYITNYADHEMILDPLILYNHMSPTRLSLSIEFCTLDLNIISFKINTDKG